MKKKIVFVEGKLGKFMYCGDCYYYGKERYCECGNPNSDYYGKYRNYYESCNEGA